MNTTEFLSRLRERSIRLWADGGDSLNYEGPPGALTPDLLTELRKRKPEILAYLHRVRLDVPEIPIAPVARDQPLPLSFAQQRLWFLDRLGAGWAYNMPAAFRLRGALDVEALKSSLAEIVQRHEVLRTTFICPKGKPMQVVSPSGDLSLSFEDLTDLPLEQREEEARRRAREEVRRPFDLVRGPVFRTTLFKLDSSDHVLVLVLHHIAGDGWSVGILLRELSVSYRALLTQSRPTLPDLTVQYADFALWQRGRLQAEKLDQQRAYWKERLGGELPRLELPVDRPRPAVQTFEGGRHEALIPASTYEAVKTLARAQGITSAIALMAAFRVLLSRYSGQQDIVLGTTIANRNRSDIENLVGCFVNSLVMRVDLAGDPTFEEVLRRERESSLGAYDHQDLPFEQLVEELSPERGLGENPIFQVSFTLQNAPVDPLSLPELECDRFPIGVASSRFDLSALAWETPNGLVVSFIYAVDLFDATSIERLAQLYERVLSAVVNNPQLRVSQVPLLEEAETRRIVVEWNKTAIEYPPTRCVHELFEAEVVRNPDATALVDAQETLSYRTLNSRANQIARYLRSIGIGPESRVGVVAHRSAQTVTGILGVLKAGAAYVPVDPASPPKRNQLILEGAGVSVLIGPGSMGEAFPGQALRILDLSSPEIAREEDGNLVLQIGPANLAYVLHTSGSTGVPKGVEVEHGQLLNYLRGILPILDLPQPASFVTASRVSADLGNTCLYGALCSGGEMHVLSDDQVLDGDAFATYVKERSIDCVKLVPSHLKALLAAAQNPADVPPRSLLVLGGEACPWELVERVWALAPGCSLVNHYGPTETTVGVLTHRLRPGDQKRFPVSVPIGRPIGNTQAYVLDRSGQPVPTGVTGELYIGGQSVSRGYQSRPDITAERFVPDAFGSRPGGRLYRTGDRVRFAREGDIQFLDRADQQVKIHGHRVELGEIDSVLSGHPAVQHATTMVRESGGGDQRLATYVVLEDPAEIDLQNRNGRSRPAQVTEALQTWLRDQLPEHMVPPTITILERFPLTPSGKVDRRALPEPDESRGSADYVAPRTMQQKKLAQIWSDVLNVDRVGAGDDFFRLGGDSILSLQLVAAANNAGLQLTPRLVFEHRTLAELAAVVGSRPNVVAEQGPVVGEVPLTPIQLWFLEQQQPEPDHFNQATMLQLREDVSPQMCEEALAALLAHHDALRLRYAQESGQWRQHIVPPGGDVPLDVVDLSGSLTSEERANRFAQTTERLQASLSLTAGPLLRAALIKCGESEPQRLCIAIHHLAVDAVSWRILLEDFQLACQQLRAGNAVRLASKTMSFRDWSHRLHEFVNSETASEQLERWLEMPWPESSEIPCDHPGGANVAGGSQHVSVELSEADTRRLLQDVPSAYNTQINDVLLTALTLAFEGWTGHRSVLVDLEGHGRDGLPGDADVSRTVGWFTSLFPVVLRVDESDDPATALKSVKEQLRAVPPGGLSYGILRFLAGEESAERLARIPQPQVRFNYLGRFDQLHDERSMFDRADESAGPLTSPRHRRTHLLDITGRVMDGRLHLHWAYSPAVHEPETVERLAKRFVESLRQLIAHCVSKEAGGFTPSDFPAARIDQTQLDRLETQFGREQIEDLYALAPMQQGMMYHSRQSPSAGMYVQQVWLEASDLDEETLLEAWQRVTARHAALRTSFIQGGDSEAIQLVRRHVNVPVTHHDLGDLDGKQQTAWMEQYQDEDRRRGLDLSGLPMRLALIRRGPGRTDCLWTHHHVALDGWSKMRVLAEVFRQYDAGCRGEELAWPAPRPYREYIAWLQRQDLAAAESYWRDQLSDFVTPTVIGADRTQVDPDEPDHGECWFELPEETLDRLQALARSWGITLNTITLGACGLLLSRYSGEQDVVVGATVSGRPGDLPGVEEMVGVFINTLPVRMRAGTASSLKTWLEALQKRQAEQMEYEHTPLWQIQQWSEVPAGVPLFETLFVFENYPVDRGAVEGWRNRKIRMKHRLSRTGYPLMFEIVPQRGLRGRLTYQRDRFAASMVQQLAEHYRRLLQSIADDPQSRVSDLEMLSEDERYRVVVQMNDTAQPRDRTQCIHQLCEQQTRKTPEAVAVTFGDTVLSYRQLNERANQVAHHLLQHGVEPDTAVAVLLERSEMVVAAFLGVLKAGGAYVPLDPTHPHERLAYMLTNCGASVVLTQEDLLPNLPGDTARVVCLDRDWPTIAAGPVDDPGRPVSPDDLAYVLHTSGSTGRPKGVGVHHGALVNLLEWQRQVSPPGSEARTVQFGTLAFDQHFLDIFATLSCGGTVLMIPELLRLDAAALVRFLDAQSVTRIFMPYVGLRQLAEVAEQIGLVPRSLRLVISAGEPLQITSSLVSFFKKLPDCVLCNEYGPAETHVVTALDLKAPADGWPALPTVGRPINNTRIYLLDPGGQPVPFGATGELFIGGEAVGRGYVSAPDLTAERFVPDPFGEAQGARLYRTGDLARYRPNGEIEFLGRADHQVKLRGYRIELGEIEAIAMSHPTVRQAVALVREDRPGHRNLVLYVVEEADQTVTETEIRRFLQERLPEYMVPAALLVLEDLPVTPNGKVDRRSLPAPDGSGLSGEYVAPRNTIEERLCEIWSDLLGVTAPGVHDNFFELGGHSLLATQALSRIYEAFDLEILISELFERPTVAAMAEYVQSLRGALEPSRGHVQSDDWEEIEV